MLPRTSEEIEYHSYLIFCIHDFFLKSFRNPEQSTCLLSGSVPFVVLYYVTFKRSWFFNVLVFLIHPILQKNLKSFLSNWERHRYQGERSPGICGMYVVMLFLLLSFSLKAAVNAQIPQMLMYVYVSLFDHRQ